MPYAQGMNMVLYCCKMMKGKINLDNNNNENFILFFRLQL